MAQHGPPRAARWAVAATFTVNGLALSSWFPHNPSVQRELELSDGTLGVALLGMAVGALVAMALSSWVIGHLGSRRTTQLAAVEEHYRRPIMSSFHGVFSLGGLVSSALAVAIIGTGVGTAPHLVVAGFLLGGAALVASRWLPPDEGTTRQASGPLFIRPARPIWGLGVVAFCVLLSEGAMADWGADYLDNSLGTGAGFAAAGDAVFSATMAIGRLTGGRFIGRYGPVSLVRVGGAVVAVGLGLALILGQPVAAQVEFGCVGAGLSVLFPIALSAAGRASGIAPEQGLAAVTALGYSGFLAGPPLIGLAAQATSLPVALGIVAALGLIIAALASPVRERIPGSATADAAGSNGSGH